MTYDPRLNPIRLVSQFVIQDDGASLSHDVVRIMELYRLEVVALYKFYVSILSVNAVQTFGNLDSERAHVCLTEQGLHESEHHVCIRNYSNTWL